MCPDNGEDDGGLDKNEDDSNNDVDDDIYGEIKYFDNDRDYNYYSNDDNADDNDYDNDDDDDDDANNGHDVNDDDVDEDGSLVFNRSPMLYICSDGIRSTIEDYISAFMVLPNRLKIPLIENLDVDSFKYPQPQVNPYQFKVPFCKFANIEYDKIRCIFQKIVSLIVS